MYSISEIKKESSVKTLEEVLKSSPLLEMDMLVRDVVECGTSIRLSEAKCDSVLSEGDFVIVTPKGFKFASGTDFSKGTVVSVSSKGATVSFELDGAETTAAFNNNQGTTAINGAIFELRTIFHNDIADVIKAERS